MKIFAPLIPTNYQAIDAAKVARTILARTPVAEGRVVVLSGEIIGASSREGLTRGSLRVTSPASSSHVTCAGLISTGVKRSARCRGRLPGQRCRSRPP